MGNILESYIAEEHRSTIPWERKRLHGEDLEEPVLHLRIVEDCVEDGSVGLEESNPIIADLEVGGFFGGGKGYLEDEEDLVLGVGPVCSDEVSAFQVIVSK